jgi:hypothetical protein
MLATFLRGATAAPSITVTGFSNFHNTTASGSLSVPSGVDSSDYILVFMRTGTARAMRPALIGSTQVFTHLAGATGASSENISVWGKQYSTSDPSSYSVERLGGTGGTFSGILVALKNAEIDVVGSLATSFTASAVTATKKGYLLALYTWNGDLSSPTGPSGMDEIERTDISLTGGNFLYGQQQSAGSTGTRVLSASGSIVTLRSLLVHFKAV